MKTNTKPGPALLRTIGPLLLPAVVILAFAVRFFRVGSIPVGWTDDELREVFSAYAIWHSGHDLTRGLFLPFTFVVNAFSFSPVPIYLIAPFVGLFGVSPAVARLPFVLAGTGVCFLAYLLILRLTDEKRAALVGALLMTWNVWAIQLSRLAHEAVFAQLFYLWGTVVFLSDWSKNAGRKILLSMVFFFLAFNSYDATKVVYIPLLVLLILYRWRSHFTRRKALLVPVIVGMTLTLALFCYLFVFEKAGIHGSRMFFFQNMPSASQAVELSRRASGGPELLKIIYHNKLTYFAGVFFQNYLYAFSPNFLFLHQEASGIFSLWNRGNLYLIELPFLVIGMGYLFARGKKKFLLVVGMMAAAALPSGIGAEPYTYATRSCVMLPWIIVPVALGITSVYGWMKILPWKIVFSCALGSAYIYMIGGYLFQYYAQWPVYSAEYYSKGIGDLVRYISPQSGYDEFLIANMGDTFVLHYAAHNPQPAARIQEFYRQTAGNMRFGPIRLISACMDTKGEDPRLFITPKTMYVAHPDCHPQKPDHMIVLPNGSPQWAIYTASPSPQSTP